MFTKNELKERFPAKNFSVISKYYAVFFFYYKFLSFFLTVSKIKTTAKHENMSCLLTDSIELRIDIKSKLH